MFVVYDEIIHNTIYKSNFPQLHEQFEFCGFFFSCPSLDVSQQHHLSTIQQLPNTQVVFFIFRGTAVLCVSPHQSCITAPVQTVKGLKKAMAYSQTLAQFCYEDTQILKHFMIQFVGKVIKLQVTIWPSVRSTFYLCSFSRREQNPMMSH